MGYKTKEEKQAYNKEYYRKTRIHNKERDNARARDRYYANHEENKIKKKLERRKRVELHPELRQYTRNWQLANIESERERQRLCKQAYAQEKKIFNSARRRAAGNLI